jgi:hypothetical protein
MENDKIACNQAAFTIVQENRKSNRPLAAPGRKRDSHRGPQQALLKQSYTPTGCFAPTGTGVSQS